MKKIIASHQESIEYIKITIQTHRVSDKFRFNPILEQLALLGYELTLETSDFKSNSTIELIIPKPDCYKYCNKENRYYKLTIQDTEEKGKSQTFLQHQKSKEKKVQRQG